MKTQPFQNWLDKKIEKYFLFLLPKNTRPNTLTLIRLILIPAVYFFLSQDKFLIGFVIFAFAVATDFMDGALARTRNRITELGKVIDPIADKLLIGTALYVVGFQYLIIKIFLIFIALEIITVVSGYLLAFKVGKPVGANIFGKIKMVLQSLSVIIFLFALILKNSRLIDFAEITLIVALVFAILAGFKSIDDKIKQNQLKLI